MNIGTKIGELIKLLKSSWIWSGYFSRSQYAIVLSTLFLLYISTIFLITTTEPYISNLGEFGVLTIPLAVLSVVFLVVWNWSIFLTGVGATIRRFHDMDMSGWHVFFIAMVLVGDKIVDRMYEYLLIKDFAVFIFVVLYLGYLYVFILCTSLLFGETRYSDEY